MYYYITEPPRSQSEQKTLEAARELLTNLGISGEFVTTSPARSVEELAELGVAKRYSTIVAVGSDRLINDVATLLAGTPYIFGALPLQNPAALQLVTGITTISEAAEALKYRRVRDTPIARIEPNKYFLTEVRLSLSRPTPLQLTLDTARAVMDATSLRVSGGGTIVTNNEQALGSTLQQWFGRLSGRKLDGQRFVSRFTTRRLVVETDQNYPVYLGNEVIARTPLAIEVIPNALKLITKRDRLPTSNVDSSTNNTE